VDEQILTPFEVLDDEEN